MVIRRLQPLLLIVMLMVIRTGGAQTRPAEGIRSNPPTVWALTNARVHSEPGVQIDKATIIIRDGLIEAVGDNIGIPADAGIIDLSGKTVYAGFIDPWVPVEINAGDNQSILDHWQEKTWAHRQAAAAYDGSNQQYEKLRQLGFTTANLVGDKGIFRGYSGLVNLTEKGQVIDEEPAQIISLERGGWKSKTYPASLMGAIAFVRQTLLDCDWYHEAWKIYQKYPARNSQPQQDLSLAALSSSREAGLPFCFPAAEEQEVLRINRLADEFSLPLIIRGSGYEYRRIDEISQIDARWILPVNFPEAPDVTNPLLARQIPTERLKHWALAPGNIKRMVAKGNAVAVTTDGLGKSEDFHRNLVKLVNNGLDKTAALAALTTEPAAMLNQGERLGRIAPGYHANLTVVDGDYFSKNASVCEVWIGGRRHPIESSQSREFTGRWQMMIGSDSLGLQIDFRDGRYRITVTHDTLRLKGKEISVSENQLNWVMDTEPLALPGWTRYYATRYAGQLEGRAVTEAGQIMTWNAVRMTSPAQAESVPAEQPASPYFVTYPEGAYGFAQIPAVEPVVLVNDATIWTCGPLGIVEGWDALFVDGKLKEIAPAIAYPRGGALIIDGNGKHLTPGIVDCHSHTTCIGVNEGTHSNSAEVRVEDVIDADDIAIYRELAGGVTTINVLHGSANTIGGQNAVLKLRWGSNDQNLIFSAAPPGIKFALGENVKQSNWGDQFTTRYPQTRLGVEQYLTDAFTAAEDYAGEWRRYRRNSRLRKTSIPPRRDLELEALTEVLAGQRLVHCHAYRSDEMLAFMRIAEQFGFRLGTFQHTLEGYKIAERLREHGVGGSSFSDWWAYKFEVYDAIPHNVSLMHEIGASVSVNSDSDELARRLNTEAAKALKYGGMSEEEALKLITINAARQLGIERWVGSLEEGKDADFVIWDASPLSTAARAEQTWIEGRRYFSLEKDAILRQRDRQTRNRFIQQIIAARVKDAQQKGGHGE